jgi:hypothetical protein
MEANNSASGIPLTPKDLQRNMLEFNIKMRRRHIETLERKILASIRLANAKLELSKLPPSREAGRRKAEAFLEVTKCDNILAEMRIEQLRGEVQQLEFQLKQLDSNILTPGAEGVRM